MRLVQEGCRIEDVDAAMTAFGMPVGPLALLDDVGIDVAAKGGEVLAGGVSRSACTMGGEEALAAAGRLGRKNGQGLLRLRGRQARRPVARGLRGPARRPPRDKSPLPAEVIEARLVLPMINEAAFCLEDGIVGEPGKLDLAMIFGTGFPPFRGGLLRHADAIGLGRVVARLDDLAERLGPALRAAADTDPAPGQRAPGLLSGLAHHFEGDFPMTDRPTHGAPADARLVPVVKSLFAGEIPEDTVFPFPEIDAVRA